MTPWLIAGIVAVAVTTGLWAVARIREFARYAAVGLTVGGITLGALFIASRW